MSLVTRAPIVATLAAVALLAVACGADTPGGEEGGVRSVLDEYRIDLGRATAPAGPVSFQIVNQGIEVHEFTIMATDLGEYELPLLERDPLVVHVVDEDSPDLTLVGEVEGLKPGSTTPFEQDMSPGSYVIICNIISHYERGMHAAFTVE